MFVSVTRAAHFSRNINFHHFRRIEIENRKTIKCSFNLCSIRSTISIVQYGTMEIVVGNVYAAGERIYLYLVFYRVRRN